MQKRLPLWPLGVATVIASSAFAVAWSNGALRAEARPEQPIQLAPPGLPDMALRPITAEEAQRINATIQPSALAVEAAAPFNIDAAHISPNDSKAAVDCLTAAIYYEAASESEQGQRAVAQVVLNRLRHPAFPKTVCGVVYQGYEKATGCQFSFTCDGSFARQPVPSIWNRARAYAVQALHGKVEPAVGTATHYHTVWVLPYWSGTLNKITTIGAHIFYRWQGFWGERQAFSGRYAGVEPQIANFGRPELAIAGDQALADLAAASAAQTLPPLYADAYGGKAHTPAAPVADALDLPGGRPLADENRGKLAADDRLAPHPTSLAGLAK